MTTPVIDTRTYRTELEQPSACGGRWGLYVDGRLIARSPEPMGDAAARDWANSQPWGAAPHPGAPPAGGRGTRSRFCRRPRARRETTPAPGPQAMRLLAPPTPARSCVARAIDGRTARPEPCGEGAKDKGLGANTAPLTPRKVKGNGPARLPPGGTGRCGTGGGAVRRAAGLNPPPAVTLCTMSSSARPPAGLETKGRGHDVGTDPDRADPGHSDGHRRSIVRRAAGLRDGRVGEAVTLAW